MKTRYYLPVLISIAALWACNKEIPAPSDEVSGELLTLEATIGEPGTKIHFTGDYGTYTEARWEQGDCIWVRSDTQPIWERGDCFKISSISSNGHTASFTGRSRKDGKMCAVYPYGLVNGMSTNDEVQLDVSDTQTILPGDCPKGTNAAVAFWADGSTSFSMKYIFGAVKFSLKGEGLEVSYFELSDANTSNVLHGTCIVTPDYDAKDIKSVEMEGKAYSNKLRLVPEQSVTLGATPYEFYVMLPEGTLGDGFTLKAYDADASLLASLSTEKNNAVVRGKVLKMPEAVMKESGATVTSFEGSGTQADPYKIASPETLSLLANKLAGDSYGDFADKYYVQTADINMSGVDFIPIGQTSDKPFKGHYDGDGKTISNLVTEGASSDNPASGIFGYANGAEITGIKAQNRGNTGSFVRVGGIVGHATNCTITSCSLSGGELSASANICAGIAAQIDGGIVKDCSVSGVAIKSTNNYVAGIVAHLPSGGTIENCMVTDCEISGGAENGGICGKIVGGTVKGCSVSSASVSGTGEDIGGIAGWTKPETTFENCTVTASTISSAKNYVAGIVALPEGATILNCSVGDGTIINGLGGLGGIAGYLKNTESTIDGCIVNDISITGTATNIGGVVGRFDLGVIKATNVKKVTMKGVDSIGGIAGRPITRGGDCIIDNCFVEDTSIDGTCYLGGIAGYIYPDSNYLLTLANCGVKSLSITSSNTDSKCGGIAGWVRLTDANSNARILNCYAYSADGAPLEFVYPSSSSKPSIGGIIGYASMNDSNPGVLIIAGCASNLAKMNVNGGSVPSDTDAAGIGALFGMIIDNAAATVKECAYVSDNGLSIGMIGANVIQSGIDGFTGSDFASGAAAKLNSFASTYSDYSLNSWTVTDGLPVF